MRIRRKFLQLTSKTYPHGTEKMLENHLPKGYKVDEFGNYYLQIGDNPKSMFTCHLDTACREQKPVNHRFMMDGDVVMTDGKTILGADDKAGMIVILYMIEKRVPGLYYFFLGEEVGCIGSKKLAAAMANKPTSINKVVSFDRKGYSSIITHQYIGRCCSDNFANALAFEMNKFGLRMKPDDTGICTDSIQFQDFIPECTNISVGYFNEHTGSEAQNLKFLKVLCEAVVRVDWEMLPTFRNPEEELMARFENLEEEEDNYAFGYTGLRTFTKDYYTFVNNQEGKKTKVYISIERINYEIELIQSVINDNMDLDLDLEDINWDGTKFTLNFYDENTGEPSSTIITRKDLKEINSNFGQVDTADIRYELPREYSL